MVVEIMLHELGHLHTVWSTKVAFKSNLDNCGRVTEGNIFK